MAYADRDGDLHLVDRRREVILVNGFNVYPRRSSKVIDDVPGVGEVAVVGVPDDVTGEADHALVVPKVGATVAPDIVLAHCAQQRPASSAPSIVRVVPVRRTRRPARSPRDAFARSTATWRTE
ncbi:MAG: hypothetical protein U0R65_02645 [Candidatus Nanopelagicales bacterium]